MADDTLQRDPDDWKTGDDPMTPAQKVYAETLTQQAGEPPFPDNLTKAEAAERIEDLRKKLGLEEDDPHDNDIDTEGDPDLGSEEEVT